MSERQRVDIPTVIGLGLLLMPLTTMWHEIGGHAASCIVLGGKVTELGAFYVECRGLAHAGDVAVALAGAGIDAALAIVVFQLWRRVRRDLPRLILWLVWVDKAFVAAGYLCFSGATGIGDLGPGAHGGIGPLPHPLAWRIAEFAIGVGVYVWLVRLGMATLTDMLGNSGTTRAARRRIAHGYYGAAGIAAVIVGLLNPVGLFVTLASAAASSFGGLAGFVSIGYAAAQGSREATFVIPRNWPIILLGAGVAVAFAGTLGPTIRF